MNEKENFITAEEVQKKLFDDIETYFEMANFWPNDTGLDHTIWVSVMSGKEGHWARIKVDYNNERIPITISDNPEIKGSKTKIDAKSFNKIREFIIDNKDALLDYWNQKISTPELVKRIKKV